MQHASPPQRRQVDDEQAKEAPAEGQGLQEGRGGPEGEERHRCLQGQGEGDEADHEVGNSVSPDFVFPIVCSPARNAPHLFYKPKNFRLWFRFGEDISIIAVQTNNSSIRYN